MTRHIAFGAIVFAVLAGVLVLSNRYPDAGVPGDAGLAEYFVEHSERDTAAENAVAAIYLNYRVYDTLFEALLLLIAIVATIHFFRIGTGRS